MKMCPMIARMHSLRKGGKLNEFKHPVVNDHLLDTISRAKTSGSV